MEKTISVAVIKRLPRYYRYLSEMLENDVVRVSSKELSEKMNVTASQIRQDFNNFGGFGQQGYGYNVSYLHSEIGKILGLDRKYNVILIGAGNLGQALANYADFPRRGYIISAIFDSSTEKIGKKINGVEIRSINTIKEYLAENRTDIAAITIPKCPAPDVAAMVVSCGVKAIWNFAPTDLHLPKNIMVENVHLLESLMRLSYKINNTNTIKKRPVPRDKKEN